MTTTLLIAAEPTYESGRLVSLLASLMETHRAVGDDYPNARANLVANLRTLQSALPAAIAEVEAATGLQCDECAKHKPDTKTTTIAGQEIDLCDECLPKLRAMSPFDA